ncbi:MAG: zinc-ribbon domain-containing protein [Promethearchaeota archaeon]
MKLKKKKTKCLICRKVILKKGKTCSTCLSFLDSLDAKFTESLQLPPQLYKENHRPRDFSDDNKYKYYPYDYIFKPPEPPKDIAGATQLQVQRLIKEEESEDKPYCKHCGAELPEGETICHVCGKKVM